MYFPTTLVILPVNYISNYVELLQNCLPSDEISRINMYRYNHDKYRFALGRLIVRLYLSKHFQTHPKKIKLLYNEYGKPYINFPAINFSISHSNDLVVTIFSKLLSGVDIEYKKPISKTYISDLFFSKNECNYLQQLENSSFINEFYRIWTAKESFLKAIGLGFTYPPYAIDSTLSSYTYNNINFKIHPINFNTEYFLSLCLAAEDNHNIIVLSEKEFGREY